MFVSVVTTSPIFLPIFIGSSKFKGSVPSKLNDDPDRYIETLESCPGISCVAIASNCILYCESFTKTPAIESIDLTICTLVGNDISTELVTTNALFNELVDQSNVGAVTSVLSKNVFPSQYSLIILCEVKNPIDISGKSDPVASTNISVGVKSISLINS